MGRSTYHTDYLPPSLTALLHFIVCGSLACSVPALTDYEAPAFRLYWLLLLVTVTAMVVLSQLDPGFVLSDSSVHSSATDPKAIFDVSIKHSDISTKALHGGKEEASHSEAYKYYQFSDPPGGSVHTEEGDKGEKEGTKFRLVKAEEPVQPSQEDGEKGEMDTSENRQENTDPRVVSAPSPASNTILPMSGSTPSPALFEDVDLGGSALTMEVRYCLVCRVEQPTRAKHCKECSRCVALHDHHCPWLGVCIGEKTRCYFYSYLLVESSLLWFSLVLVPPTQAISSFEQRDSVLSWAASNLALLASTVVVAAFTLMVTCLLAFHSYLAVNNLTTCERHTGEVASWDKISYLKQWPRHFGSPFSTGKLRNVYFYCCVRLPRGHTPWKLPKALPTPTKRRFVCC